MTHSDPTTPAPVTPPPAGRAGSAPGAPRGRGRLFVAVLVVVAVALAIAGIVPRMRAETTLARQTQKHSLITVQAFAPRRGAASEEVQLPGGIQAFADAPIFARTNGYLKRWYSDIGAKVKKGQLLAEIETPEVDQQLIQAKADLGTAAANSDLSNLTAARYSELRKTDSVSQQDLDNALGDAKAKAAMVNSQRANVRRLEELQSFERVYAPFDGVVTARNTDIGQLIDSGSANGQTRELFHMASISTLRVFVNVPQIYAAAARPGSTAYLTLAERPGQRFTGKLVRNAGSIDVASRTLLAEVDVDNRNGELLPGAYAQVHLDLGGAQTTTFVVPVSALIFQTAGLRLATIAPGDHIHLATVTPGRDFGNEVEVTSGIEPGELVVDNPPDALSEGQAVHVVQTKMAPAAAAHKG